jgi:hypothetical protein
MIDNQPFYPKKYEPSANGQYPCEYKPFNTGNHFAFASALNFMLLGGFSGLMCECSRNDYSDEEEEYDYKEMKETKSQLHKDLIDYLWHPSKLAKYLETYDDIDSYLN